MIKSQPITKLPITELSPTEVVIRRLEDFASSWNSDEDTFIFEDGQYDSSDVELANEAIDLINRI